MGPPLFCDGWAGDSEFYASTMYRAFASMYTRMAVLEWQFSNGS